MKNYFFLLFLGIIISFNAFTQNDVSNKIIIIDSPFRGSKPLIKDGLVSAVFSWDSQVDVYFFNVYKGETKKMFLNRISGEEAIAYTSPPLKEGFKYCILDFRYENYLIFNLCFKII